MDSESFWELIEECRGQAQDRAARLAWLRGALARKPLVEIVQFQVSLDRVSHEALTWDLWAAADRIFGGWCSDDGFCYFQLWMVGLGRNAFGRALADPDTLADVGEVQRLVGRSREDWNDDWPEWEALDYVAPQAYELRTTEADDCGDAFYAAVSAQRSNDVVRRSPAGARWNVRQEEEAARKLPRLSSMFPLSTGR